MFGIPSIQKLLVLAAVLAIVWFGFKFLGRLKDQRDKEAKVGRRSTNDSREGDKSAGSHQESGPASLEAEDMVKCRTCGAYVSALDAGNCGKDRCPY